MEKIDNLGNKFNFKSREKRKKTDVKSAENKNFSHILKPIIEKKETEFNFNEEEEKKGVLSELLDEVYEKGKKLKNSPTIENIKEYRWSIKRLLKQVTSNMLALEEKVSGFNILKRKRFTLIKVIDSKMESLAAEILRNQQDQFHILSRVDEINGLIIDLLS